MPPTRCSPSPSSASWSPPQSCTPTPRMAPSPSTCSCSCFSSGCLWTVGCGRGCFRSGRRGPPGGEARPAPRSRWRPKPTSPNRRLTSWAGCAARSPATTPSHRPSARQCCRRPSARLGPRARVGTTQSVCRSSPPAQTASATWPSIGTRPAQRTAAARSSPRRAAWWRRRGCCCRPPRWPGAGFCRRRPRATWVTRQPARRHRRGSCRRTPGLESGRAASGLRGLTRQRSPRAPARRRAPRRGLRVG
mmetsp:Transcript_16996/g.55370  ORF Transcript_16996/g.55370 Transcript_16996/m.55370 type:complete len:248 (+) Transcript_16996:974-1717(+)